MVFIAIYNRIRTGSKGHSTIYWGPYPSITTTDTTAAITNVVVNGTTATTTITLRGGIHIGGRC